MALWDVSAPEYPVELIGNLFPPEEMLYEYNEPLIFTFKTPLNGLAIAYLSDDQDDILRYVVAPTRPSIVDKLKLGTISIREALDQPIMWLVDITTTDWGVRKSWQIQIKDLPEDALPEADVLLYPHLEPVLPIKATGQQIKEENIPGEIIKQVTSADDEFSLFDKEGIIRELDRDKYTFTLREIIGEPERQCSFPVEQFDTVLEMFTEEQRVRIVGQSTREQRVVEVKMILKPRESSI
ncbi:MAG: hypothetical protein HQK60_00220 [Deltaproteobacteria bacterium]|nr:hypothetical protein [Deltaproteobacteria bacterium]